jgi:hypothetical protein
MTKADVLTRWGRRNDIADLHVAIRHHDAVNEQFDQLATLDKGGLRYALLDTLAEPLNRGHDWSERLALVHVRLQVQPLLLEDTQLLVQGLATPTILRRRYSADDTLGVAVFPLDRRLPPGRPDA